MRVMLLLAVSAAFAMTVSAQVPVRPRVLGVAHAAFFVHDLDQARAFYTTLLGFDEVHVQKNADGSVNYVFFKVNDRQYVQLLPETAPGSDRLSHVALETDHAEAMRQYLKAKGLTVPDKVSTGPLGHTTFMMKDPDGHSVEWVQYQPTGVLAEAKGKLMARDAVSRDMRHVGILVGALEPALAFYRDVLGFSETWRGSRDGKELSWVNLKAPDGDDYIEFMLYRDLPAPDKRGSQHHIALFVPDITKALDALKAGAAAAGYTQAMDVRTGINRKRQLNLYDPDGTRSELMEPNTIDGKPTPSSTAKPPK